MEVIDQTQKLNQKGRQRGSSSKSARFQASFSCQLLQHVTAGRISTNNERVDDFQSLFARIMEVSFQIFASAVLNLVRKHPAFLTTPCRALSVRCKLHNSRAVHRVKKASLNGANFFIRTHMVFYFTQYLKSIRLKVHDLDRHVAAETSLALRS